jgi:hypothetical protein
MKDILVWLLKQSRYGKSTFEFRCISCGSSELENFSVSSFKSSKHDKYKFSCTWTLFSSTNPKRFCARNYVSNWNQPILKKLFPCLYIDFWRTFVELFENYWSTEFLWKNHKSCQWNSGSLVISSSNQTDAPQQGRWVWFVFHVITASRPGGKMEEEHGEV